MAFRAYYSKQPKPAVLFGTAWRHTRLYRSPDHHGVWRGFVSRDPELLTAELKERKAKEAAERHGRQDALLRAAAAAKGAEFAPIDPESVVLAVTERPITDSWTASLQGRIGGVIQDKLKRMPYLRHVLFSPADYPQMWTSDDGVTWESPESWKYTKWAVKRSVADRAEITDAFGIDPLCHWGVTRGKLLRLIKSGWLDLAHRSDVKTALDKARERGIDLVIIQSRAFVWSDSEWRERDVDRKRSTMQGAGSQAWLKAEIVSRNYGRVIVLPFVRDDGVVVPGHTRNPPHEGKSPPRATPHIFSFAVYDELGRDDAWDYEGRSFLPAA